MIMSSKLLSIHVYLMSLTLTTTKIHHCDLQTDFNLSVKEIQGHCDSTRFYLYNRVHYCSSSIQSSQMIYLNESQVKLCYLNHLFFNYK